jgi:hypothetical protein
MNAQAHGLARAYIIAQRFGYQRRAFRVPV